MKKLRKSTFKQDRVTQAALLVAAASIPNTFQETLMPRNTVDQGVVTGTTMAVNFEIVNLIRKVLEDTAEQMSGAAHSKKNTYKTRKKHRRAAAILDTLMLGISYFGQKRLEQKTDDSIVTDVTKTGLKWAEYSAIAGLITTVLQMITDNKDKDDSTKQFPVGVIGGALTALYVEHQRRDSIKKVNGYRLHEENSVHAMQSILMGVGVLGALSAVSYGQRSFADSISDEMKNIFPDSEELWWNAGHTTAVAGTGFGIYTLMRKVYRSIEEVATKIEPAFLEKPESQLVSGSETSGVNWDTLSVQGRRFVAGAISKNRSI